MRIELRRQRRNPLSLLAILVLGAFLAGCSGGETGSAGSAAGAEPAASDVAEDERGVIAAHKALINAMEAGDVAAVTALMDPSSGLVIFHPFVENRFDGIGEVDAGLGTMFGHLGPLSWTEAHAAFDIEGDVAWMTSHVLIKNAEMEGPFVGRGTEIWVRRPGGWRLTHAHWSENAEVAGTKSGE
jgi:ketosteroid isomerase-like protein